MHGSCYIKLSYNLLCNIYRFLSVLCVEVCAYLFGIFGCKYRTADNHLARKSVVTDKLYGFFHGFERSGHKCAQSHELYLVLSCGIDYRLILNVLAEIYYGVAVIFKQYLYYVLAFTWLNWLIFSPGTFIRR